MWRKWLLTRNVVVVGRRQPPLLEGSPRALCFQTVSSPLALMLLIWWDLPRPFLAISGVVVGLCRLLSGCA